MPPTKDNMHRTAKVALRELIEESKKWIQR